MNRTEHYHQIRWKRFPIPNRPSWLPMKQLAYFTVSALAIILNSVTLAAPQCPSAGSPQKDTFPDTRVNGPAPGKRFRLDHWKLTLPTSSKNTYEGHPKEVSAAELADGFKAPHFYINKNGEMVFWCPVVGCKTEGTRFPRSELREMLEPGNPRSNWSFPGQHELRASCRIINVPSNPKVVFGQIHSFSGKARPLVKLQYFRNRVEALVKESPTRGNDRKFIFPDIALGNRIDWAIRLTDGVLSITVNSTTQSVNVRKLDEEWADQTFYFKAGAYSLDNDGNVTEGARVAFSRLQVSHN